MRGLLLLVLTASVLSIPAAALAQEVDEPRCTTVVVVDEEARTEVIPAVTAELPIQRYSYTGGPQGLDENGVPSTLPPGADWQANTTTYNDGTSHGGNLGLYDVSHGSSGNADWFYWEVGTVVVEEEQVIEHPAVTHKERECEPREPRVCPEDSDLPGAVIPEGQNILSACFGGDGFFDDGEKEPKQPKGHKGDLAFTGPREEAIAFGLGALALLGLGSGLVYLTRR